jgi:hypothetical protein
VPAAQGFSDNIHRLGAVEKPAGVNNGVNKSTKELLGRRFVMEDQPDHCRCDRPVDIAIGECRPAQIELCRDPLSNSDRFRAPTGCRSNGDLNPGNARG